MAKNELEEEIQNHVIEIPAYMKVGRKPNTMKIAKLANAIKLVAPTRGLSYTKEEFERNFGELKKIRLQLAIYLRKEFLQLRVVENNGSYTIFANEIKSV